MTDHKWAPCESEDPVNGPVANECENCGTGQVQMAPGREWEYYVPPGAWYGFEPPPCNPKDSNA